MDVFFSSFFKFFFYNFVFAILWQSRNVCCARPTLLIWGERTAIEWPSMIFISPLSLLLSYRHIQIAMRAHGICVGNDTYMHFVCDCDVFISHMFLIWFGSDVNTETLISSVGFRMQNLVQELIFFGHLSRIMSYCNNL